MQKSKHVVLFFVDGVGLAPVGSDNPWSYLPTSHLRAILPDGLDAASVGPHREQATLVALDTCLGVAGTPQSASGQTTLLTGCNAPAFLGCHLSGYPNRQLVDLLQQKSIFRQLCDRELTATFANAFYDSYWQEFPHGPHSATTEAALAGGLPLRSQGDLARGQAIYQDITSQILRQRGLDLPEVPPELAGQRLAEIVRQHHFTLFEFFQTDVAAHKGARQKLEQHIQNIDRMVGSLLDHLDLTETWFLLCSDHGNSEDLSNSAHTLNPVPGLSIGANNLSALDWRSIADVAPSIVRWLTV